MVRVYGSTGTKNNWSKLSGKIPTDRESEHHEEDLWVHVPLIAPSAGLQVETDGLCQRLSRKHGCTHVLENWRVVQRMELGVQRCAIKFSTTSVTLLHYERWKRWEWEIIRVL